MYSSCLESLRFLLWNSVNYTRNWMPSTEGKYNDPTGFSDWQMKRKLLQKNTGKTISFKHTQLVGANLISKAYCSLRHLIYLVRCIITKKTKSKKHC